MVRVLSPRPYFQSLTSDPPVKLYECESPQKADYGLKGTPRYTARRMSKAKLDGEARVEEYFADTGLRVERFSKGEMRQGRTPDFRVCAGNELAF